MNQASVKALVEFIIKRHNIYLRKAAGKPRPWTTDPVLQKYKFCNVYRELDRTTVWLAENWRAPHEGDPDLWFAMLVARLINWPPTLEELGYPVPWQPKRFVQILQARAERGEKVYSNAYMITTCKTKMSKVDYNIARLSRIWAEREALRPVSGEALEAFAVRLSASYGVASFLTGQVVADIKYAAPYLSAPDWHRFVLSGTGSRRGLSRLLGRPDVQKTWQWEEKEWRKLVLALQDGVNAALPKGWEPLHAQDLQNCLCEFDKYQRIKERTQRFRMVLYPGGPEE